jgi:hypothetical protein
MAYAIATKTPGVSIRRSMGVFSDEALRKPVLGCRLEISGSFARAIATGDAANRLRDAFSAQGWKQMPGYAADGKDGTGFAFRKMGVACLFRGKWNGGADDEPQITGEDWLQGFGTLYEPSSHGEQAIVAVLPHRLSSKRTEPFSRR